MAKDNLGKIKTSGDVVKKIANISDLSKILFLFLINQDHFDLKDLKTIE